MGKKSKQKSRAKKNAKKALKRKNKRHDIKSATRAVQKADKIGIDVQELVASGLDSVPLIGGLAGELVRQAPSGAMEQVSSGKGGVRGVQLVDATLGNLGTISRRKALSILINKNKRPPRKMRPTFIQVPAGQQVVKV